MDTSTLLLSVQTHGPRVEDVIVGFSRDKGLEYHAIRLP